MQVENVITVNFNGKTFYTFQVPKLTSIHVKTPDLFKMDTITSIINIGYHKHIEAFSLH